MKTCTKCKDEQPLSAFTKDPQTKDGLQAWCRGCRHAAYKARSAKVLARKKADYHADIEANRRKQNEYRAANPETVRAQEKRRYAKDREKRLAWQKEYRERNPERVKQWMKDWLRRNEEKCNAQRRAYYQANKGAIRAKQRQRYKDSPDVWLACAARRMARLADLPADWVKQDVAFGMRYWGRCCPICGVGFGQGVKANWDHWIPLTDECCPGTVPTNMIPLCETCNKSKQDLSALVFLKRRIAADQVAATLVKVAAYFAAVRQTG